VVETSARDHQHRRRKPQRHDHCLNEKPYGIFSFVASTKNMTTGKAEKHPTGGGSTKAAALDPYAIKVPDLEFDPDLAVLTPVPDLDSDDDLNEDSSTAQRSPTHTSREPPPPPPPPLTVSQKQLPCGGAGGALERKSTQFFKMTDDDEEEDQSVASASRSRRQSWTSRPQLSARASSFADWLLWRRPFLRFEGHSKGLAWDFPLAKTEKRELLLLVMFGAEQDLRNGSHKEIDNVIETAAAAQTEAGDKLVQLANRSRPSYGYVKNRRITRSPKGVRSLRGSSPRGAPRGALGGA